MNPSFSPVLTLHAVSPQEYPAVVAVWEASVRATHFFVSEAEMDFYRPLILHDYLRQLHLTSVRNAQHEIIGFSGVAHQKLEMLFLHPTALGQGLGKALLQHAVQTQNVTHLDVNEENSRAVGFYLSQGFAVVSRSDLDSLGNPHPILHLAISGSFSGNKL